VATGLPCFVSGVVPTSPATNGPGVVGAPIVCGGIAVRSGDIVVGDADGVVVVPLERAEAVLRALDQVRALEAKAVAAVEAGATESDKVRRLLAAATIVEARR
jgi:4-hydroxy-4-methyl-2-oxoglutarate aldolase